MRRAERLFRIIQFMEKRGGVVTARDIADALEVSTRTVYRDVAHLIGSGVAIEGEAGLGYALREHYHLPPLTFTFDQVEALVFGARAVAMLGDDRFAEAARDAVAKLEAVLPPDHAARLAATPIFAMRPAHAPEPPEHLSFLRVLIREKRKVRLVYRSLDEEDTARIVRPLALLNFGPVWLLTGWCELRNDFRNFRVDRFAAYDDAGEGFADEPGKTLNDYLARRRDDCTDSREP